MGTTNIPKKLIPNQGNKWRACSLSLWKAFPIFFCMCSSLPPNYLPHLLNKVEWFISYATFLHPFHVIWLLLLLLPPFHVHDRVWNGTQLCLKVNQLMVAKDQEERVCKRKDLQLFDPAKKFLHHHHHQVPNL